MGDFKGFNKLHAVEPHFSPGVHHERLCIFEVVNLGHLYDGLVFGPEIFHFFPASLKYGSKDL